MVLDSVVSDEAVGLFDRVSRSDDLHLGASNLMVGYVSGEHLRLANFKCSVLRPIGRLLSKRSKPSGATESVDNEEMGHSMQCHLRRESHTRTSHEPGRRTPGLLNLSVDS